jgi:hypothetical protein
MAERTASHILPVRRDSRVCPQCHTPLVLENVQPDGPRFDPVVSALVDHLLTIEDQLTEVKKLVEECVL